MYCVIGSGPSGVACARALLDQGATVHMVDGGVVLEAERAERVAIMGGRQPSEWAADDLAFIKEGTSSSRAGIPLKRLYGSDFPYQQAEEQLRLSLHGVGVKASIAQGGFSNVWGAAMLPYPDAELVGWPFGASRLADHYRAVAAFTGLAGVQDDLATVFPLYVEQPTALQLSRQAQRLLARLEARRVPLQRAGWLFGRSRLAVQEVEAEARRCVRCGLCMYGCPYRLIYNSSATLQQLRAHPRFTYQPDTLVESIRETVTDTIITARNRLTGEAITITAIRAYLAAGVIPSTQILLRSLSLYDRPVTMLDSQYFLVPLLGLSGTRNVRGEELHTLSQLFLELTDPSVSPHGVHLQFYSYNDLIGEVVRGAFGRMAGFLDSLVRSLEGRMLVLQGYLHSNHSGTIAIELRRDSGGDRLLVQGHPRTETRRVIRRVLRKLARHATDLGMLPLLPLTKVADPGRGFHTGGTFPMREQPQDLETDDLGRPRGWRRLHVVDSTVLPTIAAPTITYTVMANAHRIGWESACL
jgi:choline dehydrogenase-like flavoprotein